MMYNSYKGSQAPLQAAGRLASAAAVSSIYVRLTRYPRE